MMYNRILNVYWCNQGPHWKYVGKLSWDIPNIGFPGQIRKNSIQIHADTGQFKADLLADAIPVVQIRIQAFSFVFRKGILMFDTP